MPFIILIMQNEKDLMEEFFNNNLEASSLIVCNEDDVPMLFDTLDDAAEYREVNTIDSQIIELPVY